MENAIRPITLGRKNYLFCGDHQAAVSMSVVCSLLTTCKEHKVNPRTYLNDVITRMPYMQKANYEELLQMLPHKWKERNKEWWRYNYRWLLTLKGDFYSVLYRMLTYKQRIAINLLDVYSDSIIYTGTLSEAYILTFVTSWIPLRKRFSNKACPMYP